MPESQVGSLPAVQQQMAEQQKLMAAKDNKDLIDRFLSALARHNDAVSQGHLEDLAPTPPYLKDVEVVSFDPFTLMVVMKQYVAPEPVHVDLSQGGVIGPFFMRNPGSDNKMHNFYEDTSNLRGESSKFKDGDFWPADTKRYRQDTGPTPFTSDHFWHIWEDTKS